MKVVLDYRGGSLHRVTVTMTAPEGRSSTLALTHEEARRLWQTLHGVLSGEPVLVEQPPASMSYSPPTIGGES